MTSKLSLIIIIVIAIFLAFFVYPLAWDKLAVKTNTLLHIQDKSYKIPAFKIARRDFRLGLDLLGGAHLEYQANLSDLKDQSPKDAMSGVRDVIERRVNLFGVSEPVVQIEGNDRLIVELAGIQDIEEAKKLIGQTPFLEFKEELPTVEGDKIIKEKLGEAGKDITAEQLCGSGNFTVFIQILQQFNADPCYRSTGLTGKDLKKSTLVFDQNTGQPQISLTLTSDGGKLFADITKRNLNKTVAIYLDGLPISIPVVQSEITTGEAVITGSFTPQSAKDLAGRLNAGALPVPIALISQQTIGASLGAESLAKSLRAGLYALLAVAVFMILFYRLPGVAAVLALIIYTVIVLTIYKLLPVTLTLSGIAGFILSLGIAVDANVLIFARLREELKAGRTLHQAVHEGFRRAWYSIRDSHVTTLLGAAVLYIFTTSIVKGFALTLGIGVLISLFSSIVVTRAFMNLTIGSWFANKKWLF